MPRLDIFECDCGCGAQRKQSNHWFVAWVEDGQFIMEELDPTDKTYPTKVLYIAGEQCAAKILNDYMSGKLRAGKEARPVEAEA